MFKKSSRPLLVIMGAALFWAGVPQVHAGGPGNQVDFGTGAFAAQETDANEAITDAITGILSSLVPPALSQSLPSISLPAIGTMAVSSTTTDTNFDSVSKSNASTVIIDIGTPNSDTITISVASSETRAHCDGVDPELHLETSVGTVTVNGNPITVNRV